MFVVRLHSVVHKRYLKPRLYSCANKPVVPHHCEQISNTKQKETTCNPLPVVPKQESKLKILYTVGKTIVIGFSVYVVVASVLLGTIFALIGHFLKL